MRPCFTILMAGVVLATGSQGIADITINHTDRGSFRADALGGGKWQPGQDRYPVRALNTTAFGGTFDTAGAPIETERNYHAFDLSGLSGTITGATMRIYVDAANTTTGAPYQSSDPSETVNLFDVNSPASVLFDPDTDPVAAALVFDDLGTGNSYGSFVVNSTDADVYIDVLLNAQAISDLNAAVGVGSWAAGGALVFDGSYGANSTFISERVLMGNTDTLNDPPTQLVLTGTVVPEPTSVALLMLGGSALLRRRRHA